MAHEESMLFRDREDAGRRLADCFRGRPLHDPLVLAIPRGGVTVGATLAKEIGAELDVVLSRKLRAPYQREFAIGAVGEDGEVTLQSITWDVPGVTKEYLEKEKRYQLSEIERRKGLIRAVKSAATVEGRTVIVVDDGIATGSTMLAALQSVRPRGPRELIVAVPVSSPDRLAEVGRWCDETICLMTPPDFAAVGQYYQDFEPVEDDVVVRLLREAGAKKNRPAPAKT